MRRYAPTDLIVQAVFYAMFMHAVVFCVAFTWAAHRLHDCVDRQVQPICTCDAPAPDRGGSDWAVEWAGVLP